MAQANRRTVLEAAAAVFSERGWSAGVRQIAEAAGVSVETIYTNFGSKAQLLNQVLDVAVVGDDEPVALMDRPEFAALSTGAHRKRAAAAAALNTAINRRTTGLQRALREAATVEPDLAARLVDTRERQRLTVHIGGAMVAGRELTTAEADGLWGVLSQEVYALLTDSAAWSPTQYEEWLTEAIIRLLSIDE
jgi:AcrR family transcriptional regulator